MNSQKMNNDCWLEIIFSRHSYFYYDIAAYFWGSYLSQMPSLVKLLVVLCCLKEYEVFLLKKAIAIPRISFNNIFK